MSMPDAIRPGDRSAANGFRCASYDDDSAEVATAEVDAVTREYERSPVDDDVFRVYRNLYAYEPRPVAGRIESVDETSAHWRRETISFDAPYGDERVTAHLFLPKGGEPPYQAVVYYPGADAFRLESSRDMHTWWFDFIVRTGRAVIHPIYEGMYERRPAGGLLRERVVRWSMDVSRAIDYLETRDDIDATRVAYYGFSAGAWRAPIFTAVEPRFRASILLAGGLFWQASAPEIEPANFAPRATVPTLMVNARNDFFFPLEESQRPFFRLLGAPAQHKRHAVVDGGHVPDDWREVVREVLDWLDRYLGPVT
jgi:eukaryotic-like serine/threonine-protein kinase